MKQLTVILLILTALISCNKDEDVNPYFKIIAQKDSIGACPGGGAIFVLKLDEQTEVGKPIKLNIEADADLDISLSKNEFTSKDQIIELFINPSSDLESQSQSMLMDVEDYPINIRATNDEYSQDMELKLGMVFGWSANVNPECLDIYNKFVGWIETNHPELEIKSNQIWKSYPNKPRILIVEHYTFLNETYEIKMCHHAMIPPHDWSYFCIRKRNEFSPFFAAKRATKDEDLVEIPYEDCASHFE